LVIVVVVQINSVTGPIKPVVDALLTPLPVLSNMIDSDVSIARLPDLIGATGQHSSAEFLQSVQAMLDLGIELGQIVDNNGQIHFGDFVFDGDARRHDTDLKLQQRIIDATTPEGTPPNSNEVSVQNDWKVDGQAIDVETNANSHWSTTTKKLLVFPLFKQPKRIMELLRGNDVTLVEFHSPQMDIDCILDFGISLYVIDVGFHGWLKFQAGVIIGYYSYLLCNRCLPLHSLCNVMFLWYRYDTFGIRQAIKTRNPLEALNGFYLNVSQPQIVLQGGLSGHVGIDVFALEANVGGIYT
jgi:hypothetical protein